MRLVVDANILVAEVLRKRGQVLLSHPQLELVMTERASDEARHEIRKRLTALVALGRIPAARAQEVLALMDSVLSASIAVLPAEIYTHLESDQRRADASRAIPMIGQLLRLPWRSMPAFGRKMPTSWAVA